MKDPFYFSITLKYYKIFFQYHYDILECVRVGNFKWLMCYIWMVFFFHELIHYVSSKFKVECLSIFMNRCHLSIHEIFWLKTDFSDWLLQYLKGIRLGWRCCLAQNLGAGSIRFNLYLFNRIGTVLICCHNIWRVFVDFFNIYFDKT